MSELCATETIPPTLCRGSGLTLVSLQERTVGGATDEAVQRLYVQKWTLRASAKKRICQSWVEGCRRFLGTQVSMQAILAVLYPDAVAIEFHRLL